MQKILLHVVHETAESEITTKMENTVVEPVNQEPRLEPRFISLENIADTNLVTLSLYSD